MKQTFKKLLSIALITGAVVTQVDGNSANDAFGKPYFQGRSQGENLARRLVGDAHLLYRCDQDCLNGVLAVIPEYSQTFDQNKLGKYFSFRNPAAENANTMSFRGSDVPGRTLANTDVTAENFFLASNFDGTVTLKPQVKNFIADFNFRLNLDRWLSGLYFEIDVPVNWTSWNMNLQEEIINPGTTINQPPNTGFPLYTAPAPVHSIIEAWRGFTNGTLVFTAAGAPTQTAPTLAMNFARVDGKQSKVGVADVNFILGYNFICNNCHHVGVNIRGTAPTGTRPNAEFLFEPIVGNGRHATLGAGLNAHTTFWDNGCDQSLSIWFDSAAYHLFNAKQRRTFDLIGHGVGSRYLQPGGPNNSFVPGPNVTTVDSKVKINVAGEAILMLNYKRCGFTFDVGYGVWGRSKENITVTGTIAPDTFFIESNTLRINDPFLPFINTAVFINTADLDAAAAEAPSALSHKVFSHLGYTWDCCAYSPFIGVGGEAEFSGKANRAFNQWGAWVKGGFAFN